MENFANDIAAKMGNILSSKEHQNLFKKASDQTCCNNDCKCSSESCPCKKDKKTCSKSCGSCSSKKEATQNVLSRLLRLSEALDQQGFEKQASTILKIFAALHHFHSKGELRHDILKILDSIKPKTTGSDVVTVFKLIERAKNGQLVPVIEKLPFLARRYEIELPKGFAAGALDFLERNFKKTDEFLLGGGEGDELSADDSNDLKHEELSTLHSRNVPFESLSAEIEELERDPEYSGPLDEGVPFSLMERGIEPIPETRRGGYQISEIDRFLEGDGEDDLSADDCGEIRLPEAELSPETQRMEDILSKTLGEPIENIEDANTESPDTDSFDQEEFDRFLEGRNQTDMSPVYEGPQKLRKGLSETDPARIEVGEFPGRNSPYGMITEPLSLRNYNPDRATLHSSAFMKLDKYFKKNAKDEAKDAKDKKKPTAKLPEKIAKWLATAASVVLKNSGKRFSEKEQDLFEKLLKAAKTGEARPKHLNKLIAFCEQHKLTVPSAVHELAKTAAFGLFDGDPKGTGIDLETEDFLDEDENGDLSEDESNLIRKTIRKIWNSSEFQEKAEHAIEPSELSTELAEETAIEMDRSEWLDDPDHEVWTLAAEFLESTMDEDSSDEDEEDLY